MPVRLARQTVWSGFTLIELMIVVAIVSILVAIAMPWLAANRRAAHEASAIHSLTMINDAQAAYREACGRGGFAVSLSVLGRPHPSTGEPFLSPDLTSGDEVAKSGYVFRLAGPPFAEPRSDCNGNDTVESYAVTADPLQPKQSGSRYFATNGSRVIYEHTETFVGRMPAAGAPEVGRELQR